MNYEKIAESAKEQGLVKGLVAERIKFTDKGQTVIGRVLNVVQKLGQEDNKTYNMYTLDTSKGMIQISLNRNADDLFNAINPVGKIYEITYNGKVKTNKGRQCNDYIINEICEDVR